MKNSVIVSAVLAGTFSIGSVAQADPGGWDRGRGHEARGNAGGHSPGQQHARAQRWEGPQTRGQDRGDAQTWRQYPRQGTARNFHHGAPQYSERSHAVPQHDYGRKDGYGSGYGGRHYGGRPGGYYDAPRFVRGGYLPRQYLATNYWVNDWQARRLAPPPYGYQWVQSDAGELILVALATGLIANVLFNF